MNVEFTDKAKTKNLEDQAKKEKIQKHTFNDP